MRRWWRRQRWCAGLPLMTTSQHCQQTAFCARCNFACGCTHNERRVHRLATPRAQHQAQAQLSQAQAYHVTQWQRCGHGQAGQSIHTDRPRGMQQGRRGCKIQPVCECDDRNVVMGPPWPSFRPGGSRAPDTKHAQHMAQRNPRVLHRAQWSSPPHLSATQPCR
jgi:hypothetical protein